MNHFPKATYVQFSDAARLESLNRQLRYCCDRSAFYREHFGSTPHLASLAELASLPFTSPEDIRAEGRRMVCVPGAEIARIVSLPSSGTTGEAKRLYFTEGDLCRTVDFFAEGMAWMCGAGDTVGIFMPGASPNGISDLLARGLRKIGANPIHYGLTTDLAQLIPRLEAEKPTVLVGIPWQMRRLALAMSALRPRTVLLSADYTPESLPALLQSIWGCRVLEHFGMTETGYGCAVEHPEHRGMFLRRDEFIAQIIDPADGKILPFGETGELVLTTLRREAMPLIRYRTGDWARMLDPSRIEHVYGRIAQPRSIYAAQDALCALPWLYEYRESETGLSAIIGPEAPADAAERIRTLSGAENVELRRLESPVSLGIDSGKRPLPSI